MEFPVSTSLVITVTMEEQERHPLFQSCQRVTTRPGVTGRLAVISLKLFTESGTVQLAEVGHMRNCAIKSTVSHLIVHDFYLQKLQLISSLRR